nr:hypothetical protein [Mycobacterium sp. E3298]
MICVGGVQLFFSLNAFNASTTSNKVIMSNRVYSKVSLIGNGVYDGLHVKNYIFSDDKFLDLNSEDYFGAGSVFLANFEGNLEAGNYTSLSKTISKWRIRRKRKDKFSSTVLADIPSTSVAFADYLQANRTEYEYQVSPVAEDGTEGAPVISMCTSDFFGWYLCSLDNETIYKFDMNLESESIALNLDMKLFEGFTKYPVARFGKRKYHSGGLKTIPYRLIHQSKGLTGWYFAPYEADSTELKIDHILLEKLEEFITNGEPKILKNTGGDMFKVQTSNFSYQYMDTTTEQPFTISFQFTQVGDGE